MLTDKGKIVTDGSDFFLDPTIMICIVGGITFVVAFLGCVGALRENLLLLKIVSCQFRVKTSAEEENALFSCHLRSFEKYDFAKYEAKTRIHCLKCKHLSKCKIKMTTMMVLYRLPEGPVFLYEKENIVVQYPFLVI